MIINKGFTSSCNPVYRGGADGLYQVVGCFEGKPMYRRVDGMERGGISSIDEIVICNVFEYVMLVLI